MINYFQGPIDEAFVNPHIPNSHPCFKEHGMRSLQSLLRDNNSVISQFGPNIQGKFNSSHIKITVTREFKDKIGFQSRLQRNQSDLLVWQHWKRFVSRSGIRFHRCQQWATGAQWWNILTDKLMISEKPIRYEKMFQSPAEVLKSNFYCMERHNVTSASFWLSRMYSIHWIHQETGHRTCTSRLSWKTLFSSLDCLSLDLCISLRAVRRNDSSDIIHSRNVLLLSVSTGWLGSLRLFICVSVMYLPKTRSQASRRWIRRYGIIIIR